MRLVMLAKDEESGRSGCPSVYLDENGWAVVQGSEIEEDTRSNRANPLPGQTCVRIKARVMTAAVAMLGDKLETLMTGAKPDRNVFIDKDGWAFVRGPEVETDTMASLVNLLPGETGVRIAPRTLAAAVAVSENR